MACAPTRITTTGHTGMSYVLCPFRPTEHRELDRGGHEHTHGRVDASTMRSRAGIRAVLLSVAVLGLTAALQAVVFACRAPSRCLQTSSTTAAMRLQRFPSVLRFFAAGAQRVGR
jgi:hypothetical protein